MQEGGGHGAHALRGQQNTGSGPEQPPGWEAPGFPRPLLLGAATATHLSSSPPREPCQAPPSSCAHTQHDTGPVTRTRCSASRGGRAGGQAAHAQTGLPGRGTNRRACDVTAGRASHLAPAGLATGREGHGGTRGTASTDQTWARGTRGFTWAPLCLQTHPTHVHTLAQLTDVHRHLSLEHTPPPSPAPAWMLTHQLPLTLSHNPQLDSLHTSSTSASYNAHVHAVSPFTPFSHPGTPVSLHLPCSAPATGPQGSGCWTPGWTGRSSAR